MRTSVRRLALLCAAILGLTAFDQGASTGTDTKAAGLPMYGGEFTSLSAYTFIGETDEDPAVSTLTPKAVLNEFTRRFNDHDIDGIIALHDPAFVSHDNGADGNLAGLRSTMESFFTGFPDARTTVINQAVDGKLGVLNVMTSGTNTGRFNGNPPTNRHVNFNEIRVRRIEGGLIREEWGLLDIATFQAQLEG